MKKKALNRLIVFGSISIIIIVVFIITLISYSYQTQKLKKEKAKIEDKIVELREEEEYYQDEITKLSDVDYLARYARENYLYSKSGEYIIKINKKENEEEIEYTQDNKLYVVIIVVGVLSISAIVLKKIFKK